MGHGSDLNWSPLGWIGQEPVVRERVVREVIHNGRAEEKMTRIEKFMLAGVIMSGVGLAWQIFRS